MEFAATATGWSQVDRFALIALAITHGSSRNYQRQIKERKQEVVNQALKGCARKSRGCTEK